MPRNYPYSKDVWPAGSFYEGKSFSTAGSTTWPEDVGDQFEALQDELGYLGDTPSDPGVHGRLAALEAATGTAATTNTFDTMPSLVDRGLTHDGGDDLFFPSIVAGRLRITAPSGNVGGNMRRVYGLTHTGILGDSEIRSDWHDSSTDLGTLTRFQPGHAHRITSDKNADERGLATSGGASTLTDTTKAWTVDGWHGPGSDYREHFVTIIAGTGIGQARRITDNTATVLTVNAAWTINPDATSRYEIWHYATRAIIVCSVIAFGEHQKLQAMTMDGPAFNVFDVADFGAYLKPTTLRELPWHVKTRLRDNTLDVAVWVDGDPEPDYGDAGQTDSFPVPDGFQAPGLSGLYLGHLEADDWLEYDNLTVTGA